MQKEGYIFIYFYNFIQKSAIIYHTAGSLRSDPIGVLSLDNWKPRGSLEKLSIGVRGVGSL